MEQSTGLFRSYTQLNRCKQ